jgi:hypothetical protein
LAPEERGHPAIVDGLPRNLAMAARIEAATVTYPIRFVVAGDSGAWADPTADGIFRQLVRQVGALDPPPVFFANLGDFAGPGTPERHRHYLDLVGELDVPNVCIIGNHDLDDVTGPAGFAAAHGPTRFAFRHGQTRFVAIHSQPTEPGQVDIEGETDGPRDEDLAFLDGALAGADEPVRVVLMHMPPHLGGHYAPHAEWGFTRREREFVDLLHTHDVRLVCCAHGLAFDTHVHEGIRFVMSGGGGTGLCSHLRGVCAAGPGRPEDRGALFHAVELAIAETGSISGRVLQAFAAPGETRISFPPAGDAP